MAKISGKVVIKNGEIIEFGNDRFFNEITGLIFTLFNLVKYGNYASRFYVKKHDDPNQSGGPPEHPISRG